jgi:CDP-6-deoxy-D-xylo-4-hexulose-3-dehydrase
MSDPAGLRSEILRLTRDYARQVHGRFRPANDPLRLPWQEGEPIPYAGRVFTEAEVEAAAASMLDFWLTDVTPFIGPGLMRVGGRGHAAAPC